MTKRLVVTPSAKVGITTVAFILVLVMVGIFLNKISCHSSRGYTLFFRFDSSRGLARGSAVQFAGVPIGEVQTTETTEDKGAKVEVLIFNKSQKIHRNAIAVITAESVLGGKIINITEPPSAVPDEKARDLETAHPTFEIKTDSQIEPGAEVRRVDPTGFEHTIGEVDEVSPNLEGGFRFTIQLQGDERIDEKDSVTPTHDNTGRTYLRVWPALQAGNYLDGIKEPEVTDIVVAVNDVIGTVNHLVSSLEPQIETITARLDTVLANVEQMLNKEDVAALLSDLRHTLQVTSDSVDGVTADVRSMLALSKDPLLNTLGNVEATTANLEAMTAQARAVSEDPETRDKLESLLTELEASSKSLHSILEDVEGITGDEAFVGDVKGTVASARATMQKADETLTSLTDSTKTLGGYEIHAEGSQRYNTDTELFSSDARLKIDKRGEQQFYVGASDIGEGTNLDAGYGKYFGDNLIIRGGIRRGKVGVGGDYLLDQFGAHVEYYDPNNPTLDVYGSYAFDHNWGLIMGLEDVLDEGADGTSVGMSYTY